MDAQKSRCVINYSAVDLLLLRTSASNLPRPTRKNIFWLKIWNPDHPKTASNLHPKENHIKTRDAERPRISTGCKIGSWNACSISNKSSTIQEHIVSNKLDIFAIVETSHESLNSPSLIASMPAYYTCLEKARPPPPGAGLD